MTSKEAAEKKWFESLKHEDYDCENPLSVGFKAGWQASQSGQDMSDDKVELFLEWFLDAYQYDKDRIMTPIPQLLDEFKKQNLDETPTPESQWPTEAVEAFKSCVTFIEEILDREIALNWSGLEKAQAAIQWLQTSGVREGTRERENQWCDNDMKNALSEHYPGTDIDDYFKTWIVNYKK